MKVLWLCNVVLPKVSEYLGMSISPVGGWLTGLSEELLKQENISLTVCFPTRKAVSGVCPERLSFYGVTRKNQREQFERILKKEHPDVVHIFGTEMTHTLEMVNACERHGLLNRVVVNIQGLVSVLARHYFEGLERSAFFSPTLRSVFWGDSVWGAQRKFIKNGKSEILALKKVRHVVGRTDWDKACSLRINPNLRYHFCNESLRNAFYGEERWNLEKCEKYSIFVSQCSYPIKGFHYVLEAMADILRDYPEAHIYTTGRDLLRPVSLIDRLKMTSYQKYLAKLIRHYGLSDKITFLGMLGEKEIKKRYLKSHVFVSASTCENSPNSVGEAMILGCPVVTSDVGGVKNLLIHEQEGYIYQSSAPYMLAYYMKRIFSDSKIANYFSQNARSHAKNTHDRTVNLDRTVAIYNEITVGRSI
ncbi:MAG: glycosyltransferase [Opitutales bacterium]|nr:glycosyltransferase [Opitutales bacterium]